MRKTSAVLASLSLAVLTLTGCVAAPAFDGASCDRTSAANGIQNAVTVDGALGAVPAVEVLAPIRVQTTSYTDLVIGEGRTVSAPGQQMVVDLAFYNASSGERLYATEFNGDRSRLRPVSYWSDRSPGLQPVLECATAGSRVLAVLTPEDFGPQNVAAFELEDGENVVAVIDVIDVLPTRAEGALQFNDARGVPTVVRAEDGTPGIIIPDSPAPTSPVTQTLIKGDGPAVAEGDIVVMNYTSVGWDDKRLINTTWGQQPAIGPVGGDLIGASAGSQLLLVFPAVEGTPATAVVVDILGVVSAPTP